MPLSLSFLAGGLLAGVRKRDDFRFDEWKDGSSFIVEGQSGRLPRSFRMGPGACKALKVRPRRALALQCAFGTLWITVEGDTRDHVLAAGDALQVPRDSSVVVVGVPSGFLVLA